MNFGKLRITSKVTGHSIQMFIFIFLLNIFLAPVISYL